MGKINIGRVVLGGLLTAAVFFVIELVVEGMAGMLGASEKDMALEAFPNIVFTGARYHIVNIAYFLLFCMFAIWLYAAIRPRFGPGPRTAVITGLIFWFTGVLVAVNFINMGVFPMKLTLVGLLFNLIELPASVVVGASIYKESF